MAEYQLQEYRTPEFENASIMTMEEIPPYDTEDYDLFNEKEFKKYIDDIEKAVRSSREYRVAVQYERMFMDMNSSLFMQNVNNIDTAKIKIELHHTPFTLFDIALTVFNKRSQNQEPLDVELVAKEVAYLHYILYVGLIPLSKTEHKLVHNQALFVPLTYVLGRYNDFIELYRQYIPEDAMDRYNTYCEMTSNYNHSMNTEILQISPTYLKIPETDQNTLGAYNYSQLTQVMENTQNRLQALTQRPSHTLNLENNKYDNIDKRIKPFTIESKENRV